MEIRLRQAQPEDCRLMWEWANDPTTRAMSFSQDPIPWEQHRGWFAAKISSPNCLILIAEKDGGTPIGQFRVDWWSRKEGEIAVGLARDFRGLGYGNALIDLGSRRVFATTDAETLHAFIRAENQASIRAFERCSFTRVGEELVKGHHSIHYVRTRLKASEEFG